MTKRPTNSLAAVIHAAADFLVVALAAVTLAGLVAPLFPPADILNHFRPWILLAACVLLTPAALRARVSALATAVFLVNATLMALPFADKVVPPAAASAERKAAELTLLSINVLYSNKTPEKVAAFIAEEDADVVLLQEMSPRIREAILPRIAAAYPHIHSCNCHGMILLSKKPWLEAGGQPRDETRPPLIWARFAAPGGAAYRIMGTHPTYPLNREPHARQYGWMARDFPKFDEPMILAGDFNATPWSWNLTRFAWANGLSRTFTFSFGWPSGWPLQLLMIDNIFVSKHVRVTSARVGPDVGSDHRPIAAHISVDL